MLLLVQAPSKEHAIRARRLVHTWRQVLRNQSERSNLISLALVRLDGAHWNGLSRNYYLPKHVKEALDENMYKRKFYEHFKDDSYSMYQDLRLLGSHGRCFDLADPLNSIFIG